MCITSVNETPTEKNSNKNKIVNDYSIKDVEINLINLNLLSQSEINFYNKIEIEEADYKIKKFSNIYNYEYQYILGPADKISINLTDTDDLDNSYLIDQNGMIDLPFIGKIKLDGLTLSEAQNILTNVVRIIIKILICKLILMNLIVVKFL